MIKRVCEFLDLRVSLPMGWFIGAAAAIISLSGMVPAIAGVLDLAALALMWRVLWRHLEMRR